MLTTRYEARNWFKICGLNYQDVTLRDLKCLQIFLDEQFVLFRKDVANGVRWPYWIRVNDAKYFKGHYAEDGSLIEAYLTGKGTYFSAREVISFNKDGFIGFCGDSDDGNTEPVISAFVEWCDWMKRRKDAGGENDGKENT